jgi:hypothetical protein
MDVLGRMIRVQNESFDICRAEMEHPRFMVIDPNDGMMVMLTHGIVPSGDLRSMRTGDLTIEPGRGAGYRYGHLQGVRFVRQRCSRVTPRKASSCAVGKRSDSRRRNNTQVPGSIT